MGGASEWEDKKSATEKMLARKTAGVTNDSFSFQGVLLMKKKKGHKRLTKDQVKILEARFARE